MSAPAPAVRRSAAGDRHRTAEVLASAFADDPVFLHMLPDRLTGRDARLRRFFALELPRSERLGGAWTTADGAGAAVWYPPGRWKPSLRQTALQVPGMLRVFGRQAQVAGRVLSVMQAHHPARPHWYLLYLATETGRQGTGIGTALLGPVLQTCDREGTAAYLEATTDSNRRLYRRHGFQDMDVLTLADGGPPMYPMWREPR